MTRPNDCPFCNAEFVPRDNGWIHPNIVNEDKRDSFCPLLGLHLLPGVVDSFNRKISYRDSYYYEVQDGLPVFNEEGKGKKADIGFINACFEYIRNGS